MKAADEFEIGEGLLHQLLIGSDSQRTPCVAPEHPSLVAGAAIVVCPSVVCAAAIVRTAAIVRAAATARAVVVRPAGGVLALGTMLCLCVTRGVARLLPAVIAIAGHLAVDLRGMQLDALAAQGAEEPRGVVVSLLAPNAAGDYAAFVSLPEQLLIVEEQDGDGDLGIFADAVEKRLAAPYRARVLRVDERRFVVVANEIETIELPGLTGDELVVFAMPDGERTAILDGKALALARPELEPILKESAPCLLRLENVDESVWELNVDLL